MSVITPPTSPVLYGNYPNPFNPSTTVKFGLPIEEKVQFMVFNSLGQKIYSESINGKAGDNDYVFNASAFKSGIYIYCIQTTKGTLVNKMILLK